MLPKQSSCLLLLSLQLLYHVNTNLTVYDNKDDRKGLPYDDLKELKQHTLTKDHGEFIFSRKKIPSTTTVSFNEKIPEVEN